VSAADSVHCVFAHSHFTVGPVVVVMTVPSVILKVFFGYIVLTLAYSFCVEFLI